MKRGGDPRAGEGDRRSHLPHALLRGTHEPLSVAGSAALRQHGNTIQHGRLHGAAAEPHGPRHDLGMAHDAAGQPRHEPIGRVVIGMVDGGVKLGLGRWRRQAGEQLQDFRLVSRAGGSNMAVLQHPGRRPVLDDRFVRHVQDGRPLRQRPAAHHRPCRPDFDGLHHHGFEDTLIRSGGRPGADALPRRGLVTGGSAGRLDGGLEGRGAAGGLTGFPRRLFRTGGQPDRRGRLLHVCRLEPGGLGEHCRAGANLQPGLCFWATCGDGCRPHGGAGGMPGRRA